ncbi:MAG: DUF115 domain-containing protein [Desulfuromonadales bacterium]|nr:DUF115 domain-containing protein [Desulfuromonadales bacterium]
MIKSLKVYLENFSDISYREWYFCHMKRLEAFRGKHKGERCFIVGNGPSLNEMELTLLADKNTFGLNKIYLLLDKIDLNVSYHVSVNSLIIEQSHKDFEQISCPSFLSYPVSRGIVENLDKFYYIYPRGPYTFQPDITQNIHEGYTVTFVALQIAFFMGFEEVYLIGVDHNFVVSGNPNEKQRLEGEDPNHFDPNYFSGKDWHLPDLEASELSYHLANFFYKRAGRQIFDATVDGKLTVFPKISFADALLRSKTKR